MKKVLALSLITLELAVLAFLGFRIYQKTHLKNVLVAVDARPLRKENLIFPESSTLKYFYEPKPNSTEVVEKSWLPYKWEIHYNADGFNERFDYGVIKPLGTFRIITLGDSFTNGEYVNAPDNYPERLEDLLNSKLRRSFCVLKAKTSNCLTDSNMVSL